jgi:hypothetical protein
MIIVHMTGETFKRYAVVPEDEYMFHGISKWESDRDDFGFFFGAQAIRQSGIDEAYRTLSSNRITRIFRR